MTQAPDQPSDNTTLTAVVDGYAASGYVTNFWAEEGATVRCGQCQSVLEAQRLAIYSQQRLEGASDPADMSVVIATSCPVCGAEGTMVLTYGPAASDVDADVMAALTDARDEDDSLPRDGAPTEIADGTPGNATPSQAVADQESA